MKRRDFFKGLLLGGASLCFNPVFRSMAAENIFLTFGPAQPKETPAGLAERYLADLEFSQDFPNLVTRVSTNRFSLEYPAGLHYYVARKSGESWSISLPLKPATSYNLKAGDTVLWQPAVSLTPVIDQFGVIKDEPYYYLTNLKGGLNFINIPVKAEGVNRISDVYRHLGDGILLLIYFDTSLQQFMGYQEPFNYPGDPIDVILEPTTGLIAVMTSGANKSVSFYGQGYKQAELGLDFGLNLIGLPVNDKRLVKFSDLANLTQAVFIAGLDNIGKLRAYPGVDLAFQGGRSYFLIVEKKVSLSLEGEPWQALFSKAAPSAITKREEVWQVEGRKFENLNKFLRARLEIRPGAWKGKRKISLFKLLSNYPNPFNPDTWLPFVLNQLVKDLRLQIFDIKGRLIREIRLGNLPAGSYLEPAKAVYWDGINQQGEAVASGIYFYRLLADRQASPVKHMILAK